MNRFNIRVYFLLLNETQDSLLVSDEIIQGEPYTKFPGGGLEFGEGILDCVHREAREELGQEIHILKHLYTTDFFIQSAFNSTDQVISVYYMATLRLTQQFRTSSIKNGFKQKIANEESFRWVKKNDITEDDFHFPGDKIALRTFLQNVHDWY